VEELGECHGHKVSVARPRCGFCKTVMAAIGSLPGTGIHGREGPVSVPIWPCVYVPCVVAQVPGTNDAVQSAAACLAAYANLRRKAGSVPGPQ